MTASHSSHRPNRAPTTGVGNPGRSRTMSNQREPANTRLREALAREAALLRQKDELTRMLLAWRTSAADRIAALTPRQRQVMERVLAGQPNKNIAADLGISERTVESHRAKIMRRTGSTSLPALARIAFGAASTGVDEPHPLDQLLRIIANQPVEIFDAPPGGSSTGERADRRAAVRRDARVPTIAPEPAEKSTGGAR